MATNENPLAHTVATLRSRIKTLRNRNENIGEQNTKAILIEPMLSALGWDLQELAEVRREYRQNRQDGPVDYALFILRSPRLFVEAKDLGADLADRKWISQVLGYATVTGVEWCALTNGDEYRLYNAHAAVDVEHKLFRTVRLSDASQEGYILDTLDLLSKSKLGENLIDVLWKAHFVDRNVKIAMPAILTGEDKSLIRWIRKRMPELLPSEIRDSLRRADIHIEFPVVTTPPEPPPPKPPKPRPAPRKLRVRITDLIGAGLITPPLELYKDYKGVPFAATITQDGTIAYDNKTYNSLSTAAAMARKSVIGAPEGLKYPQTNGWTFWKYRNPQTDKVEEIDALRRVYLERVQSHGAE